MKNKKENRKFNANGVLCDSATFSEYEHQQFTKYFTTTGKFMYNLNTHKYIFSACVCV